MRKQGRTGCVRTSIGTFRLDRQTGAVSVVLGNVTIAGGSITFTNNTSTMEAGMENLWRSGV